MAEHTPGPWGIFKSRRGEWFIVAIEDEDNNYTNFIGEMYYKQDALLAKAAPDLLESLKALVAAYEKSLQREKMDVAIRAARIAIEKVKGE